MQTDPTSAPAGHFDLLTTVMHEMGHALGLEDNYDAAARDHLMFGWLFAGERRLPGAGAATGAVLGSITTEEFAGSVIQVLPADSTTGAFILPAGKQVQIQWQATIDPQQNQLIVNPVNTGTVSADNAVGFPDVSTNTVTTTLDTLILGGTVWNDNGAGGGVAGNGFKEVGEPGIDNVTLSLFADADNNDAPDTPGTPLVTGVLTSGGGNYSFPGLAPGNYIVRVDQANFNTGDPLAGLQISPITTPEPIDPDNNTDNDDNGARIVGQPAFSLAITLAYNTEPTVGTGNDTNNTLDLGFTNLLTDLAITKTESVDPVIAGSNAGANNLTYIITVTNNGPDDAIGVVVNETLVMPTGVTLSSFTPSVGTFVPGTGVWTIGALADQATATLTLVLSVAASAASGAVIQNTATVTSTSSDPTPGNNTATENTTIATQADLSVTKTDSPDPVIAGTNLTYTIVVTNLGPSDAQTVSLTDVIPTNTTFVSFAAPAGWSALTPAVGGTGTVSASRATLAAGTGPQTFTLVVNVNSSTPDGAAVSNTADVATATTDPVSGNNSDTETTAVDAEADLSVTKTDSPDPVIAGTNLTYTITVSNTGPSDAQSVDLADLVPANTTFVSFTSPAGWTATTPAVGGTGTVSASIATLAAGATGVFTLVVNVDLATADGSIVSNTADIASTTTDPDGLNNSATATTTVQAIDLVVTKTDSPDPVVAGTNLTYTITLTNTGSADAQNVDLSDAIPANTTFVSFTAPAGFTTTTPPVGGTGTVISSAATFAGGATAVFTLVVNVNASAFDGTILSNTVDVTTTSPEQNPLDNTDTETTTVDAEADLSVTKTDSPDPVIAGTNVTYTITVTNTGPSDAQAASLTDLVPANTTFVSFTSPAGWTATTPAVGGTGTVSASIATLAAGATGVFTLVVNVDLATADGSIVSNTADIASTTTDPDGLNNSATATTTVQAIDLVVTKTDSPDPVVAGTNLTYTITLTNTGSADAQNVDLSDAIPANTTFVSFTAPAGFTTTTPPVGGTGTVISSAATFAGGATAVFTLVVNVNASALDGTILSNTVDVTTTSPEQNPLDNTDTETTTVDAEADLSVTKDDSPDPVIAGTNVTYTITVTNTGPSDAQAASLTDLVPASTTFVSFTAPAGWSATTPAVGGTGTVTATNPTLAAGATGVFTLVVNVNLATADLTLLSNTAAITSATTDPTPGNNSDTETTQVQAIDLAVTKTDSPDPVVAGTNLTYTITVTNAGSGAAQAVSLSDVIPTNTTFVSFTTPVGWTALTPPVGGTGTVSAARASLAGSDGPQVFTLVVNVNASTPDGATLSNTAAVTTSSPDQNLADNTDTETTAVDAEADLSVTKSDSPDPVIAGTNLTYTITVSNTGPSDAQTVELSDLVPANTTFVSAMQTSGPTFTLTTPPVGGTGTFTAAAATLAAGATATFSFVVNVHASAVDGSILSNTATITSATTDPVAGNNSDTETTAVDAEADVSVTKTDAPDPVIAGTNLSYTLTITNNGPSDAQSVDLSDVIPASTTFVSFTQTAGPPATTLTAPAVGGTGTATATFTTLAAGASATFTLVVSVNLSAADGSIITNTVTGSSGTTDPNLANNSDTETTAVQIVDLSVTKSDAPDPVIAGTNLTWTITVQNLGSADAQAVSLNDLLPAGTTFVSFAAPAGWTATTPPVGGTGTITATNPTLTPSDGPQVFTLVVNVNASVLDGATLTNTATVATSTPDQDPANNSDTETTDVDAQADVAVTKTDTPDPVVAGTNLSYTLTITNAGPSDAQNVALSDIVPANTTFVSFTQDTGPAATLGTPPVGGTGTATATFATLAAGATATFTLVVAVNSSTLQGATLTNTADATASTTDPNLTNNTDTETTGVIAEADVAVTKTDTPDPVAAGTNLTYTITVTNTGPSDAQNVTLTDVLPPGTTFFSATPPAGWSATFSPVDGTVTATNPTLAAGSGPQVFTLVVNVAAGTPNGTLLTNTAVVSATTTDTNTANNSDTETTLVRSLDFGDAPDTYATLLASGGPTHQAGAPLFLGGVAPDVDVDGQPTSNATGDDVSGTDDEDGVTLTPLTPGATATIKVTASAAGRLDGFIDFNRDGDFADAGEKVLNNVAVAAGANTFNISVPASAAAGSTFARFRVSSAGGLSFGGPALDGEVEDYAAHVAKVAFGTQGNDVLRIRGVPNQPGAVRVTRLVGGQEKVIQTFGPQEPVIVMALGGNDLVEVKGHVRGVTILGGNGADILKGGNGRDILVGGRGLDRLYGRDGRDILIGGNGFDRLEAEGGSDILIGARTSFDNNVAALDALMAEWAAPHNYGDRVKNLRNGSGGGSGGARNGAVFLRNREPGRTVHDDRRADGLLGGAGLDWFFARVVAPGMDIIFDGHEGEQVNGL